MAKTQPPPPPLYTWAERFGIPFAEASILQQLMRVRHDQSEHACTGAPHPSVIDKTDKSDNSAVWSNELRETIKQINVICKRNNLIFDPGTGLWGSMMRDGRYIDDVPPD